MTGRAKLLLAALALAAVALVATRWPRTPTAASAPMPGSVRTGAGRSTKRKMSRIVAGSTGVAAATPLPTPAPDLPKLVGLVRRQGRLLAAFSQGGEVVLAGPGDTAAGVTVVDVSEDGVRVRRKDGSEELLRVP